MENYRKIIKERLRNFWEKCDDINIIDCFVKDGNKCDLCGYYPIKFNFILENSGTKELLIVGSNCVYNIKQAIEDLGEEVMIVSSNIKSANLINKYHPNTVKIIQPHDEYDRELKEFYSRQRTNFSKFEEIEPLSDDELAPEGMGTDEFDWDSYDFDPPER